MKTCKKCGHTWESRILHPKCCPACKSYAWDKERKRCGLSDTELKNTD